MSVSKKHRNILINLVQKKNPLDLEEKKFLGAKGEINFDEIKKMLLENKFQKTGHKWGAIRILALLRNFNRNKEFLEIVKKFIFDEDVEIRSYCLNLLVMRYEQYSKEVKNNQNVFLSKEELTLILMEAKKMGVNTESLKVAEKYIGL
jgi:hypothetical protein